MRISDYSTLTFDCYGTLIDWEKGIVAELKPWSESKGLSFSEDEILETYADLEAKAEEENPGKLYPQILESVLGALAAKWEVEATPEEKATFGTSVPRWPAFPDSPAALQYLKQHYKLVILSNVDHVSFAGSNARLQVEFDHIYTAQDIGSYKPNLRNFEYAISHLRDAGIEHGSILHTAQSLFHDIVPAKRLGLKTAWINRRRGLQGWGATPVAHGDATPDVQVGSMQELADLHAAELAGKA